MAYMSYSVYGGVLAPVEAPPENALHNQVIGRRGWAHADADVDLPLRRHVQIGDREDLLLLVVQRVEVDVMRP